MLQVFAHPDLSHQLVLVPVHACELTHMSEDVLQSVSQLQHRNTPLRLVTCANQYIKIPTEKKIQIKSCFNLMNMKKISQNPLSIQKIHPCILYCFSRYPVKATPGQFPLHN